MPAIVQYYQYSVNEVPRAVASGHLPTLATARGTDPDKCPEI